MAQLGIQRLSEPIAVKMSDESYQYFTPEHFWFQWRFAVLCQLLQRVDIGNRIIEVGCGNGIVRQQFEAHFQVPVSGCDLNERALAMASPGAGDLYVYNIHDRRPQWQGYFDTILLMDTLEHIDQPIEFLKSIAFHLRSNGILAVNVPALQWLYSRYDEVAGHVKRYRKKLLQAELMQADFDRCSAQYWGFANIPLLAARKLVMPFTSRKKVIERGFQPGALADSVLRWSMRTERRWFPRPWIGASLAAVAQKRD